MTPAESQPPERLGMVDAARFTHSGVAAATF